MTTFKPKTKPKSIAHSATPSNSLVTRSTPLNVPAPPKKPKATPQHLAKEMSFDLFVLRLSLIIDLCSHALVSVLPPTASQGLFVGFTSLSSIGAGVVPTLNSFALCVMQMRSFEPNNVDDGGEGRLFGALAIVQAVGQQILGVRILASYSESNYLSPLLLAHDIRRHLLLDCRQVPQSYLHRGSRDARDVDPLSLFSSTRCFTESP